MNPSIVKKSDWSCKFHLHIEASLILVGTILAQEGDKGIYFHIYCASRLLNVHEQHYTTIEREALSMIFVIKKFQHYLLGNKFIFFVDHNAFVDLVNYPQLSGQIACWILLLTQFDYTIMYKQGQTHACCAKFSQQTRDGGSLEWD